MKWKILKIIVAISEIQGLYKVNAHSNKWSVHEVTSVVSGSL